MLLVNWAVKLLIAISQNGINPIPLNKQIGNHLKKDLNASTYELFTIIILSRGSLSQEVSILGFKYDNLTINLKVGVP